MSNLVLFGRGTEEGSSGDESLDDSVLIEAYDRAVSLAKQDIERRMGLMNGEVVASASGGVTTSTQEPRRSFSKKSKKNKKSQGKGGMDEGSIESVNGQQWKTGMPCRAAYHEDGELYEAVIETLSLEEGVSLIKFIGYDNTQLTCVDDLLPSEGKWAQRQQMREALGAEPREGVMEWTEAEPRLTNKATAPSTPWAVNQNAFMAPGFEQQPAFSAIPPPPPISQLSAHMPAEESEALSAMLMSWYLNGFHTGYYMGLKQAKERSSEVYLRK